MPRQLKCEACPGWHDTDEPWPYECRGHFKRNDEKRSSLPAPALHRDEHWPQGRMCDADGKTYYNKSDFHRAVKDAGCAILMQGEKLPPRPPKQKLKLSDAMRREIRGRVQALDSPTRKLDERRRRINGG